MARITDNLLVTTAQGNVGKQFVYKRRGKNTHIARMPKVNKNQVVTDRQAQVRDNFGSASLYAQGAISSPELKKLYEKKTSDANTAFNVAFRDYTIAPVVKNIDKDNYNGAVGSTIVVKAKDDFRVTEVTVSIHSATGVLIEQGNAILNPLDRNLWIYTATQANPSPAGCTVNATAKDLPGNKGAMQITL